MVKIYKVITARKQEEIEDKINQLAVDGWEVDKFGSATAEWNRFWTVMVREK
ncbi:MAG: hypothetical protein JSV75_06595 [Candidatus Bathyarchaeota archaeon]|nr:MAG: hypothetical protein JSV75_06595 [Candidatus Bathyarchaeota archaeon]